MFRNFSPLNPSRWTPGPLLRRGQVFGAIIIAALFSFEIFNYSTTDFALSDLLGELDFAGIRWATILAIAFCGIDFAGIARLFAPELGHNRNESQFLFGAWLLAATMNAMLTWWGVSLAVLNHPAAQGVIIERDTLLRVVPVLIAILVWLIRVMIIGAFSVAGERIFVTGPREIAGESRQRTRTRVPDGLSDLQTSRFRPKAIDSQPRPTSPERSRRPLTGKIPVQARSQNQPVPVIQHSSDDETDEYVAPVYSPSPLIARSTNRPQSTPSAESRFSRTPIPRRRT